MFVTHYSDYSGDRWGWKLDGQLIENGRRNTFHAITFFYHSSGIDQGRMWTIMAASKVILKKLSKEEPPPPSRAPSTPGIQDPAKI